MLNRKKSPGPVSPSQAVWYVVADRSGALVYEESKRKKFHFVRRLLNLKGRRSERELVTDRAGRTRRGGAGPGRVGAKHTFDAATSTHEQISKTFAARVASVVETAWHGKEFGSLVIAAEPSFLGMLKKQLGRRLPDIPTHAIPKEFRFQADRELGKKLHAELRAAG